MTNVPYSLIALVGLPRSGTTLVHKILSNHSLVDGIIEPYQFHRHNHYSQTQLTELCNDLKINIDANRAILVKETTTRQVNIEHTLDLLASARSQGVYTGLIILVRSPFEAYLSQVEASSMLWKIKKVINIDNASFRQFAKVNLNAMRHIAWRGRAQHFRFVSYRQFCRNLSCETARLMGVFPLRFEPEQVSLEPSDIQGGDHKVYTTNQVTYSDRSDEASALLKKLKDSDQLRTMRRYDEFCTELERLSDADAMDRYCEIVLMR